MTITIVALTTVNKDNLDDLSVYLATTDPLLRAANATIVGRFEIEETVVGQDKPASLTIVQYPSQAAVDSVFESSEYGMLQEIRARAFSYYQIFQLNEPIRLADLTERFAS